MEIPFGNVIGGEIDTSGRVVSLKSPVDGSTIGRVCMGQKEQAEKAIESAFEAFHNRWRDTDLNFRKSLLSKLAKRVEEKSDRYASLESINTGKTLRQSMFMDIPLAVSHIQYFAELLDFKTTREISHPEYPGTRGVIQHAPMGVVAAIAPWNVPMLMAVWKTVPALLSGNTVVLKPSQHTPLTALEFARDALEVGFPPGVFNVVAGPGEEIGNTLITDERVGMVSFTGSTSSGRKVASLAGQHLKKTTLELGGKSPNIVLPDADIEHAAKGILFGIFLNSGQLCESGSRLLVHKSIKGRLMREMGRLMMSMKAGNPMDMETDISAITTHEQLLKIRTLVEDGISEGATVVYQRDISNEVPQDGYYFPPMILDNIGEESEIGKEEIFGPVLTVKEFDRIDEAVG
ncbi:MAG: aldehyde dehydrogenase family protein, partial [Thermoplasmataceae archaeon]